MVGRFIALKNVASVAAGIILAIASAAGIAQSWKPEKTVEVVVSSAPGGSNDRVARVIQKIVQEQKLIPVPITVLNKPGGNQTISRAYINQFPGDAHYLEIGNPTLIANTISGLQRRIASASRSGVGHAHLTPATPGTLQSFSIASRPMPSLRR